MTIATNAVDTKAQQRMMFFGRAPAVITLPKALFSWKTAGILTGVKLATLAVVLGLARAGLLPVWYQQHSWQSSWLAALTFREACCDRLGQN